MKRTTRTVVPGITVDNPDTKDRDDAIWLEPQSDGGCLVHVSIADVAAHVLPGDDVDVEARRRGFSRYLATRTFYMLPRNLTLHTCSLDAGRERDTVTVTIPLNAELEAGEPQIALTRLRSQAQLSYGEADHLADQPDHPLSAMLQYGFALTSRMLRARREKGALAVYDLRNGWYTDEDGELIRYQHDELHRSHILIQELMILANRTLAEEAVRRDLPQIFRNHQARNAAPQPKELADEVQEALSHPGLLSLETLQQKIRLVVGRATYATTVYGHYGLSLPVYAHMTSPIRRYVDLMNWRIWRAHLLGQPLPYSEQELGAIAEEMTTIQETMRPKRREQFLSQAARQHDEKSAKDSLINRSADDLHKLLKRRSQEGALDPQLEEAVLIRLNQGSIRPKSLYYLLEAQGDDFDRVKEAIWQLLEKQPGLSASLFDIINTEAGLRQRLTLLTEGNDGRYYWSASIEKEGQTLQTPIAGDRVKQVARHRALLWLLRLYYGMEVPVGDIEPDRVTQVNDVMLEISQQPRIAGNPKQQLNELCQQRKLKAPTFQSEMIGAVHRPVFETTVTVEVNGSSHHGHGRDTKKKLSEQRAALDLLSQLGSIEELTPAEETTVLDLTNYVGLLMERSTAEGWPPPSFDIERAGGGDHMPEFECTVMVRTNNGQTTLSATASNKQEAKRLAAKAVYQALASV